MTPLRPAPSARPPRWLAPAARCRAAASVGATSICWMSPRSAPAATPGPATRERDMHGRPRGIEAVLAARRDLLTASPVQARRHVVARRHGRGRGRRRRARQRGHAAGRARIEHVEHRPRAAVVAQGLEHAPRRTASSSSRRHDAAHAPGAVDETTYCRGSRRRGCARGRRVRAASRASRPACCSATLGLQLASTPIMPWSAATATIASGPPRRTRWPIVAVDERSTSSRNGRSRARQGGIVAGQARDRGARTRCAAPRRGRGGR